MNIAFPQTFHILDVLHPDRLDWRQVRLSLHDTLARDAHARPEDVQTPGPGEMHLHVRIMKNKGGRDGRALITCGATQAILNALIWDIIGPLLEGDPDDALIAEEPITETCASRFHPGEDDAPDLALFQLPHGLSEALGKTSHHGLVTLHRAARDAAADLARRRRAGPAG